jgi:putative transposase
VTVAEQRAAVEFLIERGLSQRRACTLVQLPRATFRYQARPERNSELDQQVQELAQQHPRYGYRRVWALLRRRHQRVDKKRVHRLWKRAKLQVCKVRRKRRAARPTGLPIQATHPGHVWTYDFVHDACLTGTPLKVLTVMDEFTREGLAIEVASSMPASKVIVVLDRLFRAHGAPQFLRSDNGPEFVALAVRCWLTQQQTATLYIDPGCPWQNAYEERFNGTVRDECLNLYAFDTVAEARVVCGAYLREYNDERPHSSLGYRTPSEYKQEWLERQSEATGL